MLAFGPWASGEAVDRDRMAGQGGRPAKSEKRAPQELPGGHWKGPPKPTTHFRPGSADIDQTYSPRMAAQGADVLTATPASSAVPVNPEIGNTQHGTKTHRDSELHHREVARKLVVECGEVAPGCAGV